MMTHVWKGTTYVAAASKSGITYAIPGIFDCIDGIGTVPDPLKLYSGRGHRLFDTSQRLNVMLTGWSPYALTLILAVTLRFLLVVEAVMSNTNEELALK